MQKIFDIQKSLPSIFLISMVLSLAAVYFLLYSDMTKKALTPGPMSKSHSFIEKNCKACHDDSFEKVKDNSCLGCHNLSQHSEKHKKDFNNDCVSCHAEHNGDDGLTIKKDHLCISCHGELNKKYPQTELENVSSYRKHPEYKNLQEDPSSIKLNHSIHLKPDLLGANGPTQLNCNSCHNVDKLGRRMEPIVFEKHCASCHTLEFDQRLPRNVAPHGKTDVVYRYLFREYSALYLSEQNVKPQSRLIRPGIETEEVKTPEFAFNKVQQVTREIERDLIQVRGCVLCHEVKERKIQKENSSAFYVRNPNLPKVWMNRAVFRHGAHEFATCESCHENAKKSEKTKDVLMPKVKNCNSCHDINLAPANCLTCHNYHDSLEVKVEDKKPADKFHDK